MNRTLAECYQRMNPPDLERARQRTLDEAGCDEAFNEDSIVRLLVYETQRTWEAERQLREAREKYESSPASFGQRTAIRNVLQLTWSPLNRLSHDVREDWVAGLWWCYGDHPEFDETERGENGVKNGVRALETHLRETLFEPLKKMVNPSDINQLRDVDRELKCYLQGAHIELGPMLETIYRADSTRAVYKQLWDLLKKRSSRPTELRNEKWREISLIRNPSSHESRRVVSGASIERARHAVQMCHEFLSILESPPAPPPATPRPGQPVSRR